MDSFIKGIPKAELHLHIEGTLEPEMMFELAKRNGGGFPFGSVDEIRAAYEFSDLQSFLDIYYQGAAVLKTEQDFYELMWAYLERVAQENVRHVEMFFDAQTHTQRGIGFETFMPGFRRAQEAATARFGMSSMLIMCFLRHLSAEAAVQTLAEARPYRNWIVGVGLDSSEVGNPPDKFTEAFQRARAEGYRVTAHAGEEGPASFISDSLRLLGAERIDHGVRCEEDDDLVRRLAEESVPLTMCPLSNVKLRVFDELSQHNLKRLLSSGVKVTINSDDPAYFGGYVTDNYLATQAALGLDRADIVALAGNSFEASFLDDAKKAALLAELEQYVKDSVPA